MYNNPYYYKNDDRQFFFPFLLGGLAGGALVGATRPKPVLVQNQPRPYPNYQPYPYYPGSSYNYSYQGSNFYPY